MLIDKLKFSISMHHLRRDLILLLLIIDFLSYNTSAQVKVDNITSKNNSIKLLMSFKESYNLKVEGGNRYIVFRNSTNESKPGSPVLPSKTIYVAISPDGKAKVNLENIKYQTFSNVNIEVNPMVSLINDSTLKYYKQSLNKKYFITNQYISFKTQVLGYTWIRSYYCAVIQINTASYNWKTKSVKILTSANLNIAYSGNPSYPLNNSPEASFDKILNKIIINYNSAKNFRTFRKFFSPKDSTGNWINYSNEYIKLAVPNDGIYRIDYQDLLDYGLNPGSIDPSTIKIYWKGKQLPLFLKTAHSGTFQQNDYIEFWATKNYGSPNYRKIVPTGSDYLNYMNRYSDTTIVWLTWGGSAGRRVSVDSIKNSSSTDTLTSYLNFQHFEKDVRLWYYDSVVPRIQLPFWQENKVWTWSFWGTNGGFTLPFVASDIVPDSKFETFVRLISNGSNIQKDAHKTGIEVNSNSIQDSITFNYKQTVNFISSFSSKTLKDGANTLRLIGMPTRGRFQQVLLDWIDIQYYRKTDAIHDSLYFRFPDSLSRKVRVIKISNLTNSASKLLLYKVKPYTVRFQNYSITGTVNKTLTFTDTVSGGDAYILLSEQYIKKPNFVEKKKFINLRNTNRGADDILISNRLLTQSVTNYNHFIEKNYNIRTALVFVNDIYDEFSYGYAKPEAIRRFLLYANENWVAPKPSYLTLIGDANYDYKNHWNPAPKIRKKDLVPSYGDPVSDVWYSIWDSSQVGIPQMFVGRIPASDNNQVEFYLGKYMKYLGRPYDKWNKTFLFFSGGDPSQPNQIEQLKNENNYIFNNLVKPKPIGGEGYHFYKTITPQSNFGPYSQNTIQSAINFGALFISYIGHSGTQTWDNGITDVNALKNSYDNRFPLITDFGCSTGKFAEPDVSAFSELFISGSVDGQAIAYLGNSSWGYISTSLRFPTYFYGKILHDTVTNIAQAHLLAKIQQLQETGYSDVNRVFTYSNILLGDPLIKLKLPTKPNLEISSSDIHLLNNNPTGDNLYLPIKILYHNYGLVPNDSMEISINDELNNQIVFSKTFKVPIPLFTDSLIIKLPIKNKIGQHKFSVILDSANVINEISENDNSAGISFNVYSTALRSITTDRYYNTSKGKIKLLNPVNKPIYGSNKLLFQFDTLNSFISPIRIEQNLGTFFTTLDFKGLKSMQRYWWRTKIKNSANWSDPNSFLDINNSYNWYIDSPVDSSNEIELKNVLFDKTEKAWELSTSKNELKISSAGTSAGSFASFQYNLKEMLPNTYFWGIVTALIDTSTLKPYNIKYFIYPNPPAGDSLLNYLKSLPQGTVLAMAICDDGAQSVLGFSSGTPVRNEIKKWGSIYIDSVRYRESWSIIGKKGAAPGSVPEAYKKQFKGIATIDTSLMIKNTKGEISFPPINNSSKWDSIHVVANAPSGATITIIPIGINKNNEQDTLSSINLKNGFSALNEISADKYRKLKLVAKLEANATRESPKLNSIAVKFNLLPELGTNYQVVSLSNDSVLIGGNEKLRFFVYNVGETPADSFNVSVDVVNSDNIHNKIFDVLVDSLNPDSKKEFTVNYNTSDGSGAKSFYINIDPNNKISEIYKDNNVYSIPFYIKPDTIHPTLAITFNGKDILDGDYISSHPLIKIMLNDNSLLPITDTSAISIKLNGKPIYYSGHKKELTYVFNTSNPKMVVTYNPKLTDGEYTLTVVGKNASNNPAGSSGLRKLFTVSNEARILYVYNYPNPFSSDTYFTFKLTQVPDEIKIKIYTIAGRLIKEIKLNRSQLKYDFNYIHWDGRDQDEDLLANGVYLYKIILRNGNVIKDVTQKLAIVR